MADPDAVAGRLRFILVPDTIAVMHAPAGMLVPDTDSPTQSPFAYVSVDPDTVVEPDVVEHPVKDVVLATPLRTAGV
jgi:hypothetical protein